MPDPDSTVYCGVCNAANPKGNGFCTRCGASLVLAAEAPLPAVGGSVSARPATTSRPLSNVSADGKKRSSCLTVVLIGLVVLGILELLVFIALPTQGGTNRALTGMGALVTGAGYVASGIALWRWKKWGFSAFVAARIAESVIALLLGFPWFEAVLGLVYIWALYQILQPVWQFLE